MKRHKQLNRLRYINTCLAGILETVRSSYDIKVDTFVRDIMISTIDAVITQGVEFPICDDLEENVIPKYNAASQ